MKTVTRKAPAKINLSLRVLGRRPDGYHEIESLMVPIELFDVVEICLESSGIRIDCPGHPELEGRANLAYRAVEEFSGATGQSLGANILIRKNIPIQAGLGGGSSDAAATLMGLQELTGHPLDAETLDRVALQLGADVPFFLKSSPCRARGIGEILQPLEDLPPLTFVLAVAPFGLDTRLIYQNLNYPLTILGNNDIQTSPVLARSVYEIASSLRNDLQATGEVSHPVIGRVCKELVRAGAVGACMTGSGPTVFGLFHSVEQAQDALARLKREQDWQYLVARGMTSG